MEWQHLKVSLVVFADLRQAGHYHEGPDERHRVGDRRARSVPVQDHQRRAQRLAGQSNIPLSPTLAKPVTLL